MSTQQVPPAAGAPVRPAAAKSRGRAIAEGLGILAITLLMIGGLLEIALRLFAPQIVPPITGLFVADPATAYRLKPGAQIPYRFAEGNTTFVINSQGLREDHTMAVPPPAGRTRMLCLGDSFTFGMGVTADQAFPHLLDGRPAADGSSVESVNAGVFGYGTDNEAAWLRTYGWDLQPRVVLLGFFVGNDVKDVAVGMDKTTVNGEGRLVATAKSQQALAQDDDTTGPAPGGGLKGWLENNSHAYLFLRNLFYKIAPPAHKVQKPTLFDSADFLLKAEPAEVTAGWSKTLDTLDALQTDVKAHGATLVIVAIPTREQVQDQYWREMQTQFGLREDQLVRDLPEQHLASWSTGSGVPVIDLLPGMQAAGKDKLLYFRTDKHWNADGHALAAELIRAGLVRLGVLK